ncbi:MAG: hypothetical protein K8U57_25075 [Planctomycetes bacterium]|nr:hypothetical protein [Planctomycetota bacterium]
MSRAAIAIVLGLIAGFVLLGEPCRASLYSPDEPFAIPVSDDGTPVALSFNVFKRRLGDLGLARVEPKLGAEPNKERAKFLERIREREKTAKPSPLDAAALAADLLRVGQSEKALALLGPHTADRKPDYFVFSTLGHLHADRGEWVDALRYHQEGQLDTKMPATVKGLSKQQRDWWEKLDAEYLPHFYQLRRHESDARKGLSPTERSKADETEDVLPLFPLPGADGPKPAVRFVNEKGEYEPGTIAASEKAKLPPDAIAVVQQLLLWFPGEARLSWLLAELYAAQGEIGPAVELFEEATWGRQYGNRKVLMAHRQAVMAVDKARPRNVSAEDQPLVQATETALPPGSGEKPMISMETIGLYFGVVGLVAVLALVRTVMKRR